MDFKVNQNLEFEVLGEDQFGNVTRIINATFEWSIDDERFARLLVSQDTLSLVVVPTGVIGTTQLRVKTFFDGQELVGSLEMPFVPGDAVRLHLNPKGRPAGEAAVLILRAGEPQDI